MELLDIFRSLAERKSSSVAADTLRFLGATVTKYDVTFSYDPCEVIRYIGQIGRCLILYRISFTLHLAESANMYLPLLGAGEGDTLRSLILAMRDLLKSFPAGVIVTGIELDTLNCLISRAKGIRYDRS